MPESIDQADVSDDSRSDQSPDTMLPYSQRRLPHFYDGPAGNNTPETEPLGENSGFLDICEKGDLLAIPCLPGNVRP